MANDDVLEPLSLMTAGCSIQGSSTGLPGSNGKKEKRKKKKQDFIEEEEQLFTWSEPKIYKVYNFYHT